MKKIEMNHIPHPNGESGILYWTVFTITFITSAAAKVVDTVSEILPNQITEPSLEYTSYLPASHILIPTLITAALVAVVSYVVSQAMKLIWYAFIPKKWQK